MDRKHIKNAEKALKPFPQRLSFLLTESGHTQEDLAKVLSKKRQSVSQYCNGAEPDFDTLVLIAKYFDVSTDWLLGVPNAPMKIDATKAAIMKYYGLSEKAADNVQNCYINETENALKLILGLDSFCEVVDRLHEALSLSVFSSNMTDEYILTPTKEKPKGIPDYPVQISSSELVQYLVYEAFDMIKRDFCSTLKDIQVKFGDVKIEPVKDEILPVVEKTIEKNRDAHCETGRDDR